MKTQRGGKRENSGREAKNEKDKAKSITFSIRASQVHFVRENGYSKLIGQLVDDEMKRRGVV